MRILVIHQYFVGPGQPGGSRFNELARLWRDAGHEVTVVAGTIDYATGTTLPGLAGRWLTRRAEEGIDVWRCRVPESYSRSYLGRMWAFVGFTVTATLAALRVERPDVIVATSPPLTTVVTGWLAAVRHGAPWIFEIRDLWPESAVTTGVLSPNGALTRLLYGLERWACRTSNLIVVLTPAFGENLRQRGLASAAKIACVPNGADVRLFSPGNSDNAARREFGWGNRIVALYAGAHGRANAIGQLVDAAECLKDRPDILIATVGDGPERARWQAEAQRRGLDNIQFCGAQPKDRMPDVVNAANIGLAVLQDNPTFRTVYPNKVFDYMACERPTVLAIDGIARQLVCDDAEAGVFAQPENAQAIADAIRTLADDPVRRARLGGNGRAWVTANATREALASRYLEHLDAVVKRRAGSMYRSTVKPALDRTAAAILLIVLAPVLILVAMAVAVVDGRPVLFRQTRPGLGGRPFTLLKFRTMAHGSSFGGGSASDAARLTRLGGFLRATSLDELPELFNVLRGEMSLVGPRPLLTQYLDRYTPAQARRHEAKPGITGWAQVNGRNSLSWEDKFRLDAWYVDHVSFWLDLKILVMTVRSLLRREGISHDGHVTMPEFLGTTPERQR